MMTRNEVPARVAQRGFVLRSIEAAATKTSIVYAQNGLEIMMVELGADAATEPSDGMRSSWHLILEGQPVLQQGDRTWEMLPSESLALRGGASYLLRNPAPERAKLLSVLFTEPAARLDERQRMSTGQKTVVWGLGVLLWTELLSIGLSAWRFGMVDWPTVGAMALITLPLLVAGAALWYRLRRREPLVQARVAEEPPAIRPRAVAVGGWK